MKIQPMPAMTDAEVAALIAQRKAESDAFIRKVERDTASALAQIAAMRVKLLTFRR